MTAVDVIKEIKALPPEDLAEVLRYLRELEARQPVQYIADRPFGEAADRIFDRHAALFQKLAS